MPGLELDDVIKREREDAPPARKRGLLELDDVIAPASRMEVGEIQTRGAGAAAPSRASLDLEDVIGPEGSAPAAPADEPGTGEGWLDALLGAEEGLTLGNTRNLGRIGAGIATRVSDWLSPSLERDGMAPEYAGERGAGDWLSELTEEAQETPAGMLGRAVGTGVTALGTGGAAGAGVGAQAATGAALSGAAAAGESDGDWLSMLEAMPAGALLGAAGGAVGGRMGVRPTMEQLKRTALIGGGLGAVTSPGDPLGGAARGAGVSVLGRAAMGAVPASVGSAVRGASQLAAAGAGTAAGAFAQPPEVAYGTAPTMAWAVQSVLASGDTGLAPEDEQRLTDALMDGDEDKVISANFALQMKSPGWSARLQRELESLQQED